MIDVVGRLRRAAQGTDHLTAGFKTELRELLEEAANRIVELEGSEFAARYDLVRYVGYFHRGGVKVHFVNREVGVSDVDVSDLVNGGTLCQGCILSGSRRRFWCPTHLEMAEHLRAHRLAGHLVPEGVISALLETADND